MIRLAIYGCGGNGRELLPVAREKFNGSHDDDLIVFVSDLTDEVGTKVNGVKVISFEEVISQSHQDRHVVLSPGSSNIRRQLSEKCSREGMRFTSIAAASHKRFDDVVVGEGAVFSDYSLCTANVRIGKHFQCNLFSYVTHDCVLGDYVTFGPRVSCNGRVLIGDDVYVGAGAVIRNGSADRPLRIGRGATVGMGAVVTKDVEPFTTVVGNPARPLAAR